MHPNVHSSTIYNNQVLETLSVPTSKWLDQKIGVHFYNGILCSRKKERTPIFPIVVDGTEEYYGKWNKPGGERQIPYDLTYKRDTMNKNKSTSKTEQETWKHRTDWQWPEGSGEEDNGGKGKGVVKEQV